MTSPAPGPLAETALASFILANIEPLLQEWDRFAGTLTQGRTMDAKALRDHAREILVAIAQDIRTRQTEQQRADKSQGLRPQNAPPLTEAASQHGLGRLAEHFNLDDLSVEFRALRASVLRSLARAEYPVSIEEITRFNEAIDQVLGVSIGAYATEVERAQALARENELRRQLLSHVQTAQDEDRRRIAQELHDSLGQTLTALSLSLAALTTQVREASGQAELQRARSLLDTAERELDHHVFQLRPMSLSQGTFAQAIGNLVDSWAAQTGVTVDLALDLPAQDVLDDAVELAVFRVVQEALTNVAKHARARAVNVAVRRSPRMLVVSVEDDGVGFVAPDPLQATSPARRAPPGWGLVGMRERIEALGGRFDIESEPGAGCTLLLRVPLRAPATDR